MSAEKTNVNVKVDLDKWNLFTYLRKKKKLTKDQALELAISEWNEKEAGKK